MELKEEQAQQIIDWLRNSFPNQSTCEFCRHPESTFSIVSLIFGIDAFSKENPMVKSGTAPVVLLLCTKCGNQKFFNAAIMEKQGCPGINILPPKPKKNVLSFLDYFKKK
jgi:hypothetical protein